MRQLLTRDQPVLLGTPEDQAVCPPLTPIPVSRPFDRIGVDIVQFPKSKRGNKYAIVFIDYLTK